MRGVTVDRALIDAAIAAGRFRLIPMGVHALDYTKGTSLADARSADLANRRRVGLPSHGDATATPVHAAALRAEGMSYDAIALRLGIAKSHAWRLVQQGGLK